MDAGDNDPSTLFHYLSLALKQARPRLRAALPPSVAESFGGLELYTRRYFEKLFSLLVGNGKHPAVMVFDDFQNVDESIHDLLNIGLGLVPENLRVVVLSRLSPPASFARLQALEIVSLVEGEALRFSEAEAKDLFDLLPMKERFSEETIHHILERCQGWVAGLRLMAAAAENFGALQSVRSMPQDSIFSYFLKELFETVPEQTQLFLMKTAFLPTLTSRMAKSLTGMDSGNLLLRQLAAKNFFITQYPGQELTYRYHPLFRDFLLEQAWSRFTQDDLKGIVHKAATMLRKTGSFEDAAALYVQGEHWENLAELILEMSPIMLQNGLQGALRNWFTFLSEDMFDLYPWLNYWKALSLLPNNICGARNNMEIALRDFIRHEDITGIILASTEMILTLFMELDDFSRIEPHFLRLTHLLANEFHFPDLDTEARVVMSIILSCIFCRPDHPDRQRWVRRADALLHTSIPVHHRIPLGFYLQIFYIYMGNMSEAGRIHAKIASLSGRMSLPDISRLQWLAMDATHAHLVDYQPNSCRAVVAKALVFAETANIHMFDRLLLLVAGYTAVSTGDRVELASLKERLEQLIPGANAFDAGNYHCLLSCEHLSRGDSRKALHQAQLALDAIPSPKSPFLHILSLIAIAEAHIEGDQWQEARSSFRKARKIALRIPGFMGEILFWIPMAYAAFRRKQDKVGLRVLKKAFARGHSQGWSNTLFWRPRQLSLLCAMALQAGFEQDYAWMLAQRHGLLERLPTFLYGPSTQGLEITTFGDLSIKRDGVELVQSGGDYQKPLILLKMLIALGGRSVQESTLMDMLWPEAEGDKARQNLKFTLHSLRKFLGGANTVTVKAKTVSLNHQLCRLDVFLFEHACMKAQESAIGRAPAQEQIKLLEHAVSLYKGDFLTQDQTDWTASTRQRLRALFLRSRERLAKLYEQAG